MMNLTRCENGHFYDADRFSSCPHCNQGGQTLPINGGAGAMQGGGATIPIVGTVPPMGGGTPNPGVPDMLGDMNAEFGKTEILSDKDTYGHKIDLGKEQIEDYENKTVGLYDLYPKASGADASAPKAGKRTTPVVGWVVAISGPHLGQSFELEVGMNGVSRQDGKLTKVLLDADNSVSRDRHANIVYEPKANMFFATPGDSKELFYLNDHVVLSTEQLSAYDVLSVGNTKLLFVPLCSDSFTWDSVLN